jgi:hypothetical protein
VIAVLVRARIRMEGQTVRLIAWEQSDAEQ